MERPVDGKQPVKVGPAPVLVSEHGKGQATVSPVKKPGVKKTPPIAPKPDRAAELRTSYVAWWRWGIRNRSRIAYSEGGSRLEGERMRPGTLPLIADCSGLTYVFADWAGLKLPYDGVGNTDSLMSQCEHIGIAEAKPGDIIVYGPVGHTAHTVSILARVSATDFECGSHGSQANPCHLVLHSVEAAYQASVGQHGVTFLRIPA